MQKKDIIDQLFDLSGRVAVITGGAGLLGFQHAKAIAACGGTTVLLDVNIDQATTRAKEIADTFQTPSLGLKVDITNKPEIQKSLSQILETFGRVDILINNAANDPKVKNEPNEKPWSRFEDFSRETWDQDIAVGLTGAMLCSQVFGAQMAKNKSGVILNVASDLGVVAPDQRIYRQSNTPDDMQPVKPVTYSAVKHGLIGLTKYLAAYWNEQGVRVNAISPGGVYNNQPQEFVDRLTPLIPLERMANLDEYQAAVVYLVSDASSYMTGANLNIDGGRTCR